jgi:hypothetical protein
MGHGAEEAPGERERGKGKRGKIKFIHSFSLFPVGELVEPLTFSPASRAYPASLSPIPKN